MAHGKGSLAPGVIGILHQAPGGTAPSSGMQQDQHIPLVTHTAPEQGPLWAGRLGLQHSQEEGGA